MGAMNRRLRAEETPARIAKLEARIKRALVILDGGNAITIGTWEASALATIIEQARKELQGR